LIGRVVDTADFDQFEAERLHPLQVGVEGGLVLDPA